MKRFGIVMGGILMFVLVLASAGCYVGNPRGEYRGYDRGDYRYDYRYDRYDRRGDRY
jgi:hypothetical protein